jgi:hypothetical protein
LRLRFCRALAGGAGGAASSGALSTGGGRVSSLAIFYRTWGSDLKCSKKDGSHMLRGKGLRVCALQIRCVKMQAPELRLTKPLTCGTLRRYTVCKTLIPTTPRLQSPPERSCPRCQSRLSVDPRQSLRSHPSAGPHNTLCRALTALPRWSAQSQIRLVHLQCEQAHFALGENAEGELMLAHVAIPSHTHAHVCVCGRWR